MSLILDFFAIIFPVATLIAGFYAGYKIGSDKELPDIKTPTQVKEEKQAKAEAIKEQNEIDAYLDNIENYPYNQKDIPGESINE